MLVQLTFLFCTLYLAANKITISWHESVETIQPSFFDNGNAGLFFFIKGNTFCKHDAVCSSLFYLYLIKGMSDYYEDAGTE